MNRRCTWIEFGSDRRQRVRHVLEPLVPQRQRRRIQDEFARFASEVPQAAVLRHTGRVPTGASKLTEQVLQEASDRPSGWGAIADRLPYSQGRIALEVRDLLLAEILETEVDYPVSGVV